MFRIDKIIGIGLTVLLLGAGALLAQPEDQHPTPPDRITGAWQGTLKVMGSELRLVFRIAQSADGTLTALLDSPDQGAKDIPTSKVTFERDSLRIESALIHGLYQGRFHRDSLVFAGFWKQGGMSFPLDLKRGEVSMRRPQEPALPLPYRSEEVTVHNTTAGIDLAGTLTRPASGGPFPAAVLITGSGPQDRDEALMGHRPFLVLADYLTRHGIAVLRMDDRGVGKSKGSFAAATTPDFTGDALAGVAYLKSLPFVQPRQIGLIGHSEGGIVAPMAANRSRDVAWIILLAGTGLPGEEILYRQGELIARASGASAAAIANERTIQEKLFAVVKTEKNDSLAAAKLRPILEAAIAGLSEEEKKAMGPADLYFNGQIRQITSPWFRYFLTYDPVPALKRVKCPVLAINGALDLQVPPRENLQAIERALQAGGNRDYTVRLFPGLNHLFQNATTGAPSEYGQIEETLSPVVLETLTEWILARTAKIH
ncbi:MAG TPA: alpha/beta fold hydrolase [bacterium]|nr:alpha/beta fold hydrolase [bacterium]HQI49265.1 alpha/beta fold hydrolase [bacterium]HQJ63651.1 alpha/beta fold hydrolase [bacterium]